MATPFDAFNPWPAYRWDAGGGSRAIWGFLHIPPKRGKYGQERAGFEAKGEQSGFCQNSEHGQKMEEKFPHFPSKKAPLCVHFPHASLVLKGAFPTFSVDFPSYPEF